MSSTFPLVKNEPPQVCTNLIFFPPRTNPSVFPLYSSRRAGGGGRGGRGRMSFSHSAYSTMNTNAAKDILTKRGMMKKKMPTAGGNKRATSSHTANVTVRASPLARTRRALLAARRVLRAARSEPRFACPRATCPVPGARGRVWIRQRRPPVARCAAAARSRRARRARRRCRTATRSTRKRSGRRTMRRTTTRRRRFR